MWPHVVTNVNWNAEKSVTLWSETAHGFSCVLLVIMGRHCFVPNCKTGYSKDKISTSQSPKDLDLRHKWNLAIPRQDRSFNEKLCVWERHFR